MDPRLKLLSYSSLLTLHNCAREFQLYRLSAKAETLDTESSITFAYGHIVGDGIQKVFEGWSEDQIIFKMFLDWNCDLDARDDKRYKNFYLAVIAVQKFMAMRQRGLLEEYELVWHEGKPASELGFIISFPDGFKLRGSVDAVLRNTRTEEIIVLECKTASAKTINPASYKNSAQAIGYSVVLDVLFPTLSSYKVLYLIYKTTEMAFEQFIFPKSYLQRALWIQELLLDIETIKMYEAVGVYPMRGEHCIRFYKECPYMQTCTLSTAALTKPISDEELQKLEVEEDVRYKIKLTLEDIVNAQLSKAEIVT